MVQVDDESREERKPLQQHAEGMMITHNLSPAEVTRYSQQIALTEWGREAQEKMKSSRVLLAGAGGLGSAVALHLLATGVGALLVVDQSRVSLADLNGTILYRERDLGKTKSAVAERRLKEINPFVTVEGHGKTISEHNVTRLVSGCQLIIDAMQEQHAGEFLNFAAVRHRLPLIYAWVGEMDGLLTTFWPGQGPCLACYLPEAPLNKYPALMGPLPGIMGALLSLEALRTLGGMGPALVGRLLIFKGRWFYFKEERIRVNPHCPVCGPLQVRT
jgi:molybdopterin/thiamine biosynthesis adenylyltransferase